ncbi:uncharacterized protein (TIGR00661 family) [Ulvibacter sp. MAR_2010_11]|uniref:glycosyltransferase n=1 Tax=Ulvibacter sp. MAR_2010_11 TaxID=1250229 RepID=UPI000C2BAFDB|nr:glycosyltransferase [Ulvibacter sp. MAR_2010_11]PKA82655.1 uncharacterized protein (TIGR00661 family) [Ulvibacter sp. MAR_2010_11]
MAEKKTILVAPLHWGLGHATRCIPIINALLQHNFSVIIASDGAALLLLQKEFPQLTSVELPSYNITYSKKGSRFKWAIFLKLPHIRKTMASEKKIIAQLVSEGKIDGSISDNRFGVRNKKIPSVFITHQLNVLSGNTTLFSSKIHQRSIKKFDECWVPDCEHSPNLSGKLGHLKNPDFPIKYLGPLSRMKVKNIPKVYDILALLSGPEPQRTLLEEKLITELKGKQCKVLLVKGMVEKEQQSQQIENITVVNFMETAQLEEAINTSDLVISRSGYTTVMDLAAMEKKAFFIPTPGQYEQKYLAKRLKSLGLVPSCKQENFSFNKLKKVPLYKGLKNLNERVDFETLFRLFERK